MEINNNYGSMPMTELGMLQQELLTARTEMLKQQGITRELVRVLGEMKLDAIKKTYPSVKVSHEKYGVCSYEWKLVCFVDSIKIYLNYYVKNVPLEGLSKSDKVIARRYNDCHNYERRKELSYRFNSIGTTMLYSCIFWDYDFKSITSNDFLTKGIHCDEMDDAFAITLQG